MNYFAAITLCFCALLLGSLSATAELKYYPDPVYQKLSEDDPSPMADVIALAEQGNARAEFIMGDLSTKGKGGMPQDLEEARRWFGMSAIHGYYHSFIRLAAIAKRENKPAEAWQWYTLAVWSFDHKAAERKYALEARDALEEVSGFSHADLRQAKKAANAWEYARNKALREEKEAALKKDTEQENRKNMTAGATEHEQN